MLPREPRDGGKERFRLLAILGWPAKRCRGADLKPSPSPSISTIRTSSGPRQFNSRQRAGAWRMSCACARRPGTPGRIRASTRVYDGLRERTTGRLDQSAGNTCAADASGSPLASTRPSSRPSFRARCHAAETGPGPACRASSISIEHPPPGTPGVRPASDRHRASRRTGACWTACLEQSPGPV